MAAMRYVRTAVVWEQRLQQCRGLRNIGRATCGQQDHGWCDTQRPLSHRRLLPSVTSFRDLVRPMSMEQQSKESTVRPPILSKDTTRELMAVFPDVVRDLGDFIRRYDDGHASRWFVRASQYNVPQGKKTRGLALVYAHRLLAKPDELTAEKLRRIYYLAWCIELLHTTFLITDDVMDGAEHRRGQLCWHQHEDVQMIGLNDMLMLDAAVFYLLKELFRDEPYYMKLVNLFLEMKFITTVGESLDKQSASLDLAEFTMDRYTSTVAHKTSYYTFYLPIAAAMIVNGITDEEAFRQAKTILLEMGLFYQIQDDFLDCFGDPADIGKSGTDIAERKFSWLAVVAMQRANDRQKALMKECYGSQDPERVTKIKHLYEELGLRKMYTTYEEESYSMIKTHIQQLSRGVPQEVFYMLTEKIYQRKG